MTLCWSFLQLLKVVLSSFDIFSWSIQLKKCFFYPTAISQRRCKMKNTLKKHHSKPKGQVTERLSHMHFSTGLPQHRGCRFLGCPGLRRFVERSGEGKHRCVFKLHTLVTYWWCCVIALLSHTLVISKAAILTPNLLHARATFTGVSGVCPCSLLV